MTKTLLLVLPLVAATGAPFGCSSPATGGRPHDAGMDVPPPRRDAQAVDYYCPADAMGGGVCPINFCGTLATEKALSLNPASFAQSGADALCNRGRVCVVGDAVATGDAFQLTCVDPAPGAVGFGAPCSPAGAAGMQCANDSLCVASPDFPTQPFCSTMCRFDADCPASSSCLEYTTATAPDGTPAKVGMCTPSSKIAAAGCTHEGACPAGQGCVSAGARTALYVCKATTATKTVGAACAGNADCLSGACFDQTFKLNGGTNRTYCSSTCTVNSDCGASQICARLVQNNNGTPSDPSDDVVVGQCQTLFIPNGAAGCGTDADCVSLHNGSDTCDAAHGLCYSSTAVPGSACTADAGCMLGGLCATGPRFPGGYCQSYGCAPNPTASTPTVDLCQGAGSVCAQRGGPDAPLYACYDGCVLGADGGAETCLRQGQYTCSSATGNATPNICL
ncbi:MAG TPA: hypothetical protein VHB30_07245, partial [Solirubrobacteraceae bacterium]|nr:hypothetical protein [Solirubrobacteraceae bacterium]